ncbi:MAG TPA: ATP-binding protein [Bacteroidales bacterium]|nr:ATP-binding protein [Bacteroidales bacterium]
MLKRRQTFEDLGQDSAFLWGARQTGKTTLLKELFPDSIYIDLLLNSEFLKFNRQEDLLRQIVEANKPAKPVIIDEIQRLPHLLNDVQWLMTNTDTQFILSGSSPRKILRSDVNLLGGRALRHELYPLVYPEFDKFDINKILNFGSLPRHYLSKNPKKLLSAYIGSYLQDEIISEAKRRNVQAFIRFLESAALTNGEIVNYSNIASDCGVSSVTIKEYFNILEETLIGRFVPAFTKKQKRRLVSSPKFYYFDLGITNYLLKNPNIKEKTPAYGKALEHLIYTELYAHSKYSGANYPIAFWRTSSQREVDFILGDHQVAIEVKSGDNIQNKHLKGLKSFSDELKTKRQIIVCNETYYRKTGNIEIMPVEHFLSALWSDQIIH